MAEQTETEKSQAKEEGKKPGRLNSLIYAAGDSRVKGILYGLISGAITFGIFYFGRKPGAGGQPGNWIDKAGTAIENFSEAIIRLATITFPGGKDRYDLRMAKKDAAEGAARDFLKDKPAQAKVGVAFGLAFLVSGIVNHLAQIPYFERARRHAVQKNKEVDAMETRIKELETQNVAPQAVPVSITSYRDKVQPSNTAGFAQGVDTSRDIAAQTTGQSPAA